MNSDILYFFLILIFMKEAHALRYDTSNNLQPYMWVISLSYFVVYI